MQKNISVKRKTTNRREIVGRVIDPVFGESLLVSKTTTQRVPDDIEQFTGFQNGELMPPEDPELLAALPKRNSILLPCIQCMVSNIESPGHRIEEISDSPRSGKRTEYDAIRTFLDSPNPFDSITAIREQFRQDLETFGYGFLEIVRGADDRIASIYNVRSHKFRLIKKESTPVKVQVPYISRDGATKMRTQEKYFRKYVQLHDHKMQRIYYKEFGDSRHMDAYTGEYGNNIPIKRRATELIHFSIYDPSNSYGSPRYINNIPAILGSRECELVNFSFFKENAVPNMAVLCSGGFLTEDSINELHSFLTQVKGRESIQRVVVLEATGDTMNDTVDGKVPPPTLDIKMLGKDRQQDEQFQNYDSNNIKKVLASFRLPGILVGFSDDYIRNVADSAKAMAESQVFQPERRKIEELFNKQILPGVVYGYGHNRLRHYKFVANAPKLTSQDGLTDLIDRLNKAGSISANTGIKLANDILGLDIKPYKDTWADLPFGIIQSLANANNLAGMEGIARETGEIKDPKGLDNNLK
jgi:PBSX family phage portal protein